MYSLEASLAEQTRRKRPSLDIVSSRKFSATTPVAPFRVVQQNFVSPRKLDGLLKEEKTFLQRVQNRSRQDNFKRFFRSSELLLRRLKRFGHRFMPSLTPHKMLYGSIVGGIAFGMVSMAFMEHYFGPGVFARSEENAQIVPVVATEVVSTAPASVETYDPDQDVFFEYFGQVTKERYEESIRDMVKGYPIEPMLPFIFAQDRLTAAFLIGIAKKESNWGKRVPVLKGQDCFNYWGYRGIRRMMGSGGHTCFNSRADAVATVSTRLEKLIHSEKLDTPEKMIVWKCGFSC